MNSLRPALTGALLAVVSACLPGCSSSDSYSTGRVSTGGAFYYGSPYPYYPYYGYGGPDYIVVAPPRPPYPGGELPVRPVQPIAPLPGGDRPTTLPAASPDRPSARPATSSSSRSRMPSAQPRMSSPAARPSIPNRSRGSGGRRGR